MINPKTIKLNALPVQISRNALQKTTKSGKAGKVFGQNFKDFLQLVQKMDKQGMSGIANKGLLGVKANLSDPKMVQKKQMSKMLAAFQRGLSPRLGHASLIDHLRESLLTTGKPLNQLSLKQEDFSLLKDLLRHLGFSGEKAEEILKGLAEKNQSGEILLSQFVQHMTELGTPDDNLSPHIEPSVVPQLESVLRNLGLRPKEVEQIFNETRHEQGGLDLKKLVAKLKTLHGEMKDEAGPRDQQVASNQISDKLEKIGLHTQVSERPGQVSLKDFIASLERMTGTGDQDEPYAADIKETVSRILERVSISKENQGPQTPLTSLGKLRIDTSDVKEKIATNDGSFNNGIPSQKKRHFASQVGKGSNQTGHDSQKPKSPNPIKGLESHLNENKDQGIPKGLRGENTGLQTEKTSFPVPSQTTGSGFSETIQAVKQNQVPTRDVLPAYLVDQVGRQISRSILKGDRVLKIQLKPPELGVVKVALDLKDNVLKLGMIAENSAVKELLLGNAGELREALVEQGVKLEKIDVQIGDHSNQNLSDLKEGLKEGRHGDQRDGKGLSRLTDHSVDVQNGPLRPNRNDQLLDLVA